MSDEIIENPIHNPAPPLGGDILARLKALKDEERAYKAQAADRIVALKAELAEVTARIEDEIKGLKEIVGRKRAPRDPNAPPRAKKAEAPKAEPAKPAKKK